MVGRVSIFSDPKVVRLVKEKFVPISVELDVHGKEKSPEGDLYRKIVAQRSTQSFQGFYTFDTTGKVLSHEGGSKHSAERLLAKLEQSVRDFRPAKQGVVQKVVRDPNYFYELPDGAAVLRVNCKVLNDVWNPGPIQRFKQRVIRTPIFEASIGRDRAWIRSDEIHAMKKGELPQSLARRIARFHLIDITHCFPQFWEPEEIRSLKMTLQKGKIVGKVLIKSKEGERGYEADLLGYVSFDKQGNLTRFDLLVKGDYWGGKKHGSQPAPPKERFPFAVAFSLAEKITNEDRIAPAGLRRRKDYLK